MTPFLPHWEFVRPITEFDRCLVERNLLAWCLSPFPAALNHHKLSLQKEPQKSNTILFISFLISWRTRNPFCSLDFCLFYLFSVICLPSFRLFHFCLFALIYFLACFCLLLFATFAFVVVRVFFLLLLLPYILFVLTLSFHYHLLVFFYFTFVRLL